MSEEIPKKTPQDWLKVRWVQNTLLGLGIVIGVYGLIYRDVVSRAKEAYQEGERYMVWSVDPDKKKQYFEEKYQKDKDKLNHLLQKNKITEKEFYEKLDVLEFDKEFQLQESSLKYAYQWYKDTYELFSPPESKWVKLARQKAPVALENWKQELREKKIPFEETMFE